MKLDEKDLACLWDMQRACREIIEFSDGVDFDHFAADRKLVLAVERSLEIIGEAAGRVSTKPQSGSGGIPWKMLRGMRNILAHDYGQIDYEVIYRTATHDVPELLEKLKKLLR